MAWDLCLQKDWCHSQGGRNCIPHLAINSGQLSSEQPWQQAGDGWGGGGTEAGGSSIRGWWFPHSGMTQNNLEAH